MCGTTTVLRSNSIHHYGSMYASAIIQTRIEFICKCKGWENLPHHPHVRTNVYWPSIKSQTQVTFNCQMSPIFTTSALVYSQTDVGNWFSPKLSFHRFKIFCQIEMWSAFNNFQNIHLFWKNFCILKWIHVLKIMRIQPILIFKNFNKWNQNLVTKW